MIDGKPLSELSLSAERWAEIKHMTIQGGSNIIKLRGRSSFQSPAYQAVKMIEGAMGGEPFTWPAGCFVKAFGYEFTKQKLENQSKNMEENLKKNAKTSKDAKEVGQNTVYVIN